MTNSYDPNQALYDSVSYGTPPAQNPVDSMLPTYQTSTVPAPGSNGMVAAPPTPVQANQPKPGGLTSSPTQTTAANIQNLQEQQDWQERNASNTAQGNDKAAAIQNEAAAEAAQHAADFNNLLQQHGQAGKEDHDRVVSSWKQHAEAAAASGKDPTNEFWNDHGGFAGRLLGSLGAFASGLGSGLLGKGGNPFLDHINEEINKNYDAHRKHIDDLYNSAVEAGRIEKDSQSKRDFDLKAKLQYYDLASQSIQHQLDAVANTTQSGAVKLLAQKTALDLDNQITGARSNLYQQQAAQGAAALAQQRSWDKEVRAAYQDALTKHGATMSEADARVEAAKDVEAAFGSTPTYHQSLAKVVANTATGYDKKTGKYVFPETLQQGATTPEGIPTTDIYGHRRKPEEIEKDKQLVVHLPDGTSGIASSPDDKKRAEIMSNASLKIDQFHELLSGSKDKPGLLQKFVNGTITQDEIGQWNGARAAAIAATKGAETGSTGITGIGQIKQLAPEQFPEAPMDQSLLTGRGMGNLGVIGNQFTNWDERARGQLDALKQFSEENQAAIRSAIRPETIKGGSTQQAKQAPKLVKPGDVPDVR